MTQRSIPGVEAYWQAFLETLSPDAPAPFAYSSWGFGDSPDMADALGALVRNEIKTATASLLWAYEAEGEPVPEPGDYSVVLDGMGEPLCIIQTTAVRILPFDEVGEEHAYLEGEGDRTLAHWQEGHWRFFGRECAALGREPDPKMPVVCERFRLVYP